jgi:hypothetical protein
MTSLGTRGMLIAALALAATGAALTPGASARSTSVRCASYDGPPATWADFTQVKASGVPCALAEKLIRGLYGNDYAGSSLLTLGAANQHVVFAKDVKDVAGGYNLRLVGQPPKYRGDIVSTHVLIGAGLPDPNGHQVP